MAEARDNTNLFMGRRSHDGRDNEEETTQGFVDSTEPKQKTFSLVVPSESIIDQDNNNGHIVDIDKWVDSLTKILDDVPQYLCSPGHPGRITRIPKNLKEIGAKAYEPYFLSIGPYHYGKPRVQRMEKRKRVVLKCFLEQNPNLKLKNYLKEMKNIESAARSFYSDVQMDSEEFLRMLLLDSFFLVTVFCGMTPSQEMNRRSTRGGSRVDNVYIQDGVNGTSEVFETDNDYEDTQLMTQEDESSDEANTIVKNAEQPRWFWYLFAHDIFLLENQLPLFVLQKIYNLTYGGSETQLMVTLKNEFPNLLSDYLKLDSDLVISPNEEIHHLLHLCHMFFRPMLLPESAARQLPESFEMFRLGSAVQLYGAGISFEARTGSTNYSLLDITCSSGKMIMPCLQVDDNTNSLLRNLIALEQMKYPRLGLNVSAYAVLLLHLITTPEDVKLLRKKGLIQHHLASDKEMMYLVNRLSVGLAFDYFQDNYSLKPVFYELKRYTEHRMPRWCASLKHTYFTNPWTAISLFAASLLLFLTAVQTYYSVYSYYYPCFDCISKHPSD